MQPIRSLILCMALATTLLVACGSDDEISTATSQTSETSVEESLEVEFDETTGVLMVRNRSTGALDLAGSVGLEVFDGQQWVSANDLLEQLSGAVVASTLQVRVLQPTEVHNYRVPLFNELPPGRYRAVVAYAEAGSDRLSQLRQVEFER